MGFATGFTGGVTLTLGLAYLTVLSHQRNRQSQALYLRSQSHLLNSLIDPTPQPPPLSRAEIARQERTTFTEMFKDRWNQEIENAVHRFENTDWTQLREGMEGAVARLLGQGLEKSREGVEELQQKATPRLQEAVGKSKSGARQGLEQAAQGLNRGVDVVVQGVEKGAASARAKIDGTTKAAEKRADRTLTDTKVGADQAGQTVREIWDRGVEKSHEIIDKAQAEVKNTRPGTIDAARGVVRNVVNKGIEKGREVIGQATEAVGLTSEKVEKAFGSSVTGTSEVDKALQERYEKPHGLDQTVEEALADRYKSIDQMDNTVLRGV